MQKRMDVKIHTQWCLTCIALTVAVIYMYTYQRRMTMLDLICNKCVTVYSDDDLELLRDNDGFFKGCGVCKTDAYLMDLKETNNDYT